MIAIRRKSNVPAAWFVLVTTLCVSREVHGNANAAEVASVDEITAAWRKREDQFKSYRVEWIETRTDVKGSIRIPRQPEKLFPPQDTTFKNRLTLVVDNERSRFEFDGSQWTDRSDELDSRKYVSLFDGNVGQTYHAQVGDVEYPSGSIRAEKANMEATAGTFRPLGWFYRPLTPRMGGFHSESLHPTPNTGRIDDVECRIVEVRDGNVTGRPPLWSLWVAPDRDFVILRAEKHSFNGRARTQFDIRYRTSQNHGFLVAEWSYNRQRENKLVQQFDIEVVSQNVNPPVPDDAFDLEFPVGTWVTDLRSTPEKQVIVRKGVDRPVYRSEAGTPYKKLRDTDPPGGPYREASTWDTIAWVGLASLMLLATGVFIVIRARRRP